MPSADPAARLETAGRRGHRRLVAGVLVGGVASVDGWAAAGAHVPAGDTPFEIGSVTKALTGVLLADLVSRGEVGLDDPLSRHLAHPRPAWPEREPTLLELATHRSGLPNVPGPLARREIAFTLGLRRRDPWAGVDRDAFERLVRAQAPRKPPGGRVRYSSLGVGLLGEALAARAGRPYAELLAERVLRPLGMTATGLDGPAPAGRTRRGRPAPPLRDQLAPAGALCSTAADLLRLLAAALEAPGGPLGEALTLAQRPHARVGPRLQAGLGWMLAESPGGARVAWHNGGTWGFSAFAAVALGRGAAVVVLADTARSVDRLGWRLLQDVAPAQR